MYLGQAGASATSPQRAMTILLFNPFLFVTSSAWGQFDCVAAVCALAALLLLYGEKDPAAGILLALSIALKPIALALFPIFFFHKRRLALLAWTCAALLVLCVVPFVVLRWDPGIIQANWNAQFSMAGGLSWLSIYELVTGGITLPSSWQILGFLWVPAVTVAAMALRPRTGDLTELVDRALRLTLVFFLTRTWLSEPNVVLVLALAAVLWGVGRLRAGAFHALWIIPLVFAVLNTSISQLFTFVSPRPMQTATWIDQSYRAARIILRSIVALLWMGMGWKIVLSRRQAKVVAVPAGALDNGPLLSVVLPTFNEAANICEVIRRAENAARTILGERFEIIVVDDDSPDGTGELAEAEGQALSNVRVIHRARRQGLAGAILQGFGSAGGATLAVMDADLQHPPEDLISLWDRMRGGADLAIMSRYAAHASVSGRGRLRRAASDIAVGLTHALLPGTCNLSDPISGFFMVRRAAIADIDFSPIGFKLLPEILARGRQQVIAEVPLTFAQRHAGRSKMEVWEPLRYVGLLVRLRRVAAQ